MLAARTDVPTDPSEYLFLAIKGSGPIRVADLRRWVIRPALEAAGLPASLRTYDLRHSHASLLIDLGANPLEVATGWGTPIRRSEAVQRLCNGTQRNTGMNGSSAVKHGQGLGAGLTWG